MKDCKIVQDLLPNYIEKLTNEETNKFIENHLESCDSCKKIFEDMKNDFNTQHPKVETNEVNFAKKLNKKISSLRFLSKFVIIILIVLLFIFIVNTTSKFLILQSLSIKASKIENLDNYHLHAKHFIVSANTEYPQSNDYTVTDTYFKNGNFLCKVSYYTGENVRTMLIYKNNGENLICQEFGNNKTYQEDEEIIPILSYTPANTWWENLYMALFHNINKVGDCYVISSNKYQIYLSQKTGLKCISYVGDFQFTTYEFGTVTDADIARPDLTGFTKNSPTAETKR